jgi:hypothetical protein
VAVVWDVNCNEFELTATDPDGDRILATPMVDGPFKGNSAAFDVQTQPGEVLIADGGYTVNVLAVQNPVAGESPIPLVSQALPVFNPDSAAVRSCVGGCAKFSTTDLQSATDTGGAYQYAQVVLPLTEATPFWSQFRKYDESTGQWGRFVIDGRNDVKTALFESGIECPEPGSGAYDRPAFPRLPEKLRDGDNCVQITIEDGGPNDTSGLPGVPDGTVSDPGGVAEVAGQGIPSPATSGGGCTLNASMADNPLKGGAWWLLLAAISLLGLYRRRA